MTVEITDEITPVFAAVGPYCVGSAIDALPAVSDNGITGTWSPVINNTQTTTYTFTPDAGQCAVAAELTITISDEITPTFDPVGPVCRGQSITLPLVSTNGITGSWTPAVDNTQTTEYTFTPNEGQCGTTATLTVTVEESITPVFDPVGPFCSGADIPALPIVSVNNVQGTWSPVLNNNQTTLYTFTPDNNSCAASVTLTIVIEESITPTFSAVGPYCIGSDIPALPVTSNNNITGTWSPEINNTQTTTYTFTPDDGGCTTTATLTIVIDESITPTFDEVGTVCRGAAISLPSTSTNGIHGSWSPAINTSETTTYTFTPDEGQCGVNTTMTINVTDEITPSFDPVGPYCPGEDIAALPTVSNNGISGTWTPAINNTQTTIYTFIPDAGQCGTTATMTIVIDQSITPIFTPVGPYCHGSDIDELPTTSNNGISGSWSPDINNSETTTYTFTPDEGQCGSQTTMTITISDEITPSFDPVAPICSGGAISLPAISREGIRGTWSPAIDNTQTTTYTFTPTDSQCASNGSLTVEVTESITPDFDAVGPYCLGSDIPDLPTTSNNDITGSWSPAINNTTTTVYTFTPDAGQCGEITTLIVVVDESILPTFDPVGPYCEGSDIDELPTTSNNNIRGSWSPDIDNTRTTTYTFTPEDGQCGASATLTIVVNPRVIPSFDPVDSYCPGSDIASLPTTSNNGIRGSWSPDIDNTQTTTYTFTPDDDECAVTSSMTIVIEQGIVPVFSAVGPYCPGAAIAALPTTSNNGITGSWSPAIDNSQTTTYRFTPDDDSCAETVTLTIEIDQDITPSFDPVGPFCPGTAFTLPLVSREGIAGTWNPEVNTAETTSYTFTPNEGECGTPATLTVAIQDNITPTFEPMGPYCSGDFFTLPVASVEGIAGTWSPDVNNTETTTYTFTPQGGDCSSTASLTIVIDETGIPEFDAVRSYCAGAAIPELPTVSNNGISGSWSPEINNTATTTYTFTPDNECASVATLTIAVEESIVPSFDPVGPYCQGSTIADLPSVSNNGVSGSWSPGINNMQTTTYTFTPDDGQCAVTASLTIVIEQGVTPTFDPVGPYCLGSDIPELPTTSNNDITGSWSPAINNMGTTVYTFTPDNGQCGASTTLTIAIQDNVTPEFDPVASICSGASFSLPGVSNNGIRGSWSPDIDNTQTTTYTFTPDAGQCASTASLIVNVEQILVPVFDPVASYCPGADIPDLPTLSNNGIRGTWSPDINNTQTTIYTFTPDADQCATAATLTIVINQSITPLFDPFGSYCRGSEIAELPTTSNNNITGSWSPALNNNATTVYTFTPDGGQCASEITATITITDQITPDFDPVAPICSGAAISLPVVSTNGIRGSWSPALDNTQTTTYTFTPEDGQCSETVSLTIEVQESITPSFDPLGPVCRGASITLPDRSNEGITGTWRPAINNMQTTAYTFTPDAGQCAVNATLTVVVRESVTPAFTPVGPYCSGSAIADLPTVSNNGITGTWSPDIDNTQTTTYTFTPGENQCGTTTTLTITVSDEITPTFDPVGPVCSGTSFTLPVVSENGIRGSWSPEINNNATITYTFTPDDGQCGVPVTLTVEVRESILPTFEPIGPVCRGTAFTLPEASNEGITGRWSPAVNNTQTTTYTFVPYPGQCGETATLTVNVEERVTPTFDPVGPFCPGEAIAALPTVSTNNIRGSWSPAIDNTRTATYTFTPDEGQCATNARLTITIDQSITPTFDRVGPYCPGAVIAELPAVSNNGIRGTWSPAINNMQTTTYTFTPDAGQCGTTATMTITISDEVTPTFTADGPYCVGETIAALPTVSNNGIRGTWSPAINNTQTTTYTFTPDAGQCGTSAIMVIEIEDRITPTFNPVGPFNPGSVIAALPTTSTNGIRGSWSPAINNTQTTTYTFTPDANQCAIPTTLIITISDLVIPTFDPVGPYCEGTVIAALPTVSNNGISGSWSPAINNTQTTTYTFTPDAGQGGAVATMVIEIEDRITPTFNPVGPYNPGTVIAALPTVSNNGISGTWSPAINNTQTTTYTFTPDANQCAIPTTLIITISDLVIPTFDPVGPYCEGSIIAALPTVSNNGIRGTWSPAINNTQTTTYTFTPDAGQGGAVATMVIEIEDRITPSFNPVGPFNPGSVIAALPTVSNNGIRGSWSPAINNTQTTTYTFTPDANQCAIPATLIITISDLVIPTFDPVGPYCEGSIIAALPTVSNNGIRGTWSPAINNSQTTTYTFTPDAGQGGAVATMVIEIEVLITPTFDPVGPYCPGAVIAALPTISNNGIRGSWSPAINNQVTTTYTFTPDANQCGETTTLTIAIEDEMIPLFSAVGSICRGASFTLPSVSNNGIRGSWRPAINNTQTTTYTFTPDAGQCGTTASMIVAVEDEVAATFDPVRPICRGASVTLPAVSNNGIRGSWQPAINSTQTTTYTFTPTAGQCGRGATVTIVVQDGVVPTFDPIGPLCSGATIVLPVTSREGIPGRWRPAINNTRTTTYTFTPESGQCAQTTTMTVVISDQITPTFTSVGPFCPGSVIAALPTVSNNGIRGSWSPAINNTQTTTYTFTPDAGQCGTSTTMTITISDEATPTFDPVGPYCPGSVIAALPTLSNNGIRGSWSPAINNTQTTTYTFTPDAGQCGTTATLEIVISDEFTPTFNPVGPFCPGSVIAALPTVSTNGIRGSWSPAINNTQTTTYTFTPDAGQCAVPTELTIGIGEDIIPSFILIGPYCPGTILQALPQTSLNGISGSWSPVMNNMVTTEYIFTPYEGQCALATTMVCEIGEEVTPVFDAVGPYCSGTTIAALPTMSRNGVRGTWSPAINNTQTTTYTFTPTDDQCAVTAQLTIVIVDEITPVFAAVRSYCQGETIAALPTVSTNGVRGTWSPAINNMQTTTYTFTPNPGQCGVLASMIIEVDEPVIPTFDAVDSYCPGAVIAALPTVSNNGIRGTWSPAINNIQTTTYTFTPDQGQCAAQATMTIVIESSVLPLFDAVGPYCQGAVIAALPTTSTNGITGVWSPAINNTRTTTYTFTPAAGQCATPATMIVVVDPVPGIPVTRVIQPNCITPTGTVEVISPRGTRYQYSLDGGNYQMNPLFTGLAPESRHTITVRDISTECESMPAPVIINAMPLNPAIPVAELTVKPTCAGDGVVVVVDPAGPEYEFSMDGGAFQANPVFTNVAWGAHSIRVRNSTNGCVSAAFTMEIPPVIADMDNDAIADELDLDVDGDGILNIHEGALTADSDGDGRMNYMDIDADNDGITDHFEAQNLSNYLTPSLTDIDQDGVDDAYDISQGGVEIIPVDSERDGTPDFLDLDSDNDMVPDYIEGHDEDANGKPDHYAFGKDGDQDGLDDGYDIIVNECMAKENALGTNASMQDFDGDGLNDWRDDNDDDDEYLTKFEDLNADSDYSNDDMDFDGAPEYLDYGRECDLFIPDAFSPNGDDVHDYYQIYCINHYPDARLFIFDQLGNKIYEKAHYGNLAFWGNHDAAWWNGRPTRGPGYSRDNLVPPGTYYYVLDLGNGEVKKSYVFVSY
ncbi:MAG TPA: gliding motility-associated C-terminal domain-containing protein [Prolixibacteraceae bacterium]|nr:gliding motility-associated C-terminal domain-containing protein [Prolixibacteraceae bacterium]